jgi:hypothetical protein
VLTEIVKVVIAPHLVLILGFSDGTECDQFGLLQINSPLGVQGTEGLSCLETIHYWHVQVHQDHVKLLFHATYCLYGLLPVHGGFHLYLNLLFSLLLRDLLKELLQYEEVIGRVIHAQDFQSLLRLPLGYHLFP